MANAGAAVGGLALMSLLMLRNCDTCVRMADDVAEIGARSSDDIFKGTRATKLDEIGGSYRSIDDNVVTDANVGRIDIEMPPILHNAEPSLDETIHGDYAIVNKAITSDEALSLRNRGVKFVCNESFQDHYIGINDYEIIYVYSDDIETLKSLYGINNQQAQEVKSYSTVIENNSMVKKVGSKDALLAELEFCEITGKKPILIFHNKNNTLFDLPVQSYGVKDLITCNSYQIPETSFSSLDFINLEYVLRSVNTATSRVTNMAEFYRLFAGNYSDIVQRENNKKVIIIASVTAGTVGGVSLIVYYNKD